MSNIESARIFLSYVPEDLKIVGELYENLKKADFEPWIDVENIIGGQNRRLAIINAVKRSHFF